MIVRVDMCVQCTLRVDGCSLGARGDGQTDVTLFRDESRHDHGGGCSHGCGGRRQGLELGQQGLELGLQGLELG